MIDFEGFNAAFLDTDFLGRDAVWTPTGLPRRTIRVAFSLGVEDVTLGGDIVPQGTIAQAGCKSADVDGIKQKETLEIDGETYVVLKIQPDETGWTTLFLGKRYG
ncbi:MAG: hypothetical protein D4R80_06560 [Deltaproteobacteria bacterium]|nr:MAG: hypothetical protein D4R80_06560 [Deltaproteobacteria bacterium]